MTTKNQLIKMFDTDIAGATGLDRQDLEVVRGLIARTDDLADPKAFMDAIRAHWTLAEQDAYVRASAWKRRQGRNA